MHIYMPNCTRVAAVASYTCRRISRQLGQRPAVCRTSQDNASAAAHAGTQFTYCTGTKSTNMTQLRASVAASCLSYRCSQHVCDHTFYLLYWYKCTNTDAAARLCRSVVLFVSMLNMCVALLAELTTIGALFRDFVGGGKCTCFTSKKVQILTLALLVQKYT